MESVILKKGRDKALLKRHHWIFSGAISIFPDGYQNGEIVSIKNSDGKLVGWGFFNRESSLSGRVLSFGEEEIYASLKKTLLAALNLRKDLLNNPQTTACRLVNGEGDGLPGLIIDKYGPYLVIQTGALGMRKLLPFFCDQLKEKFSILGIYDKSVSHTLKEEGIPFEEKILWGEVPDEIIIKEEGTLFKVSLKKGQKTGFFLDQREMRKMITGLSYGKRVLNGFCYTGGFTLAALKGGAIKVDSVDISPIAIELCKDNVLLNHFTCTNNFFFRDDIFDFLSQKSCDYDLVILDPPAFARKKKDVPSAIKGYKKIFDLAIRKMPMNSILLISSCSYHISEEIFEKIVGDVALSSRRSVRILGYHRHAHDHPINFFHPESNYLKSIIIAL